MAYRVHIGMMSGAIKRPATEKADTMKTLVGKFTFAVPEGHAEHGKKIDKAFEYPQVENDTEAQEVMDKKEWKLTDMVNENLKSNARSNAYQAALLPYRPSEVSPDEIKERMVRDFIRLGVAEDVARAQVDGLLASQAQTQA